MRVKKLLPALPLAFLVACGGGGSSDDSPVFPIEAAVVAYLTSSQNFTTTYRDPGNNDYTLAYSHTPGNVSGAGLPIETTPSTRTVNLTIDLRRNGVQLEAPSSQTDYFETSPFRYLGTIEDSGEVTIAANQASLPATAKVGDKGNLFTSTTYKDSSKATTVDTTVSTWDLQPDTANTAFFCFNSTVKSANGDPDVSGSECYKIDTSGKVVGNKITFTISGQTLTFTN